MEFVQVGTARSCDEFHAVTDRLDGERMYQFAELLGSLSQIETHGFAGQAPLWESVPQAPDVKVYYGTPERGSSGAIWAAIVVGADGRTVTLLKMTDTYSGSETEREGLLADALHRYERR